MARPKLGHTAQINLLVKPEVREELMALAAESGTTMMDIIRKLINLELERTRRGKQGGRDLA